MTMIPKNIKEKQHPITSLNELQADCVASMRSSGFAVEDILPLDLSGRRIDFKALEDKDEPTGWYFANFKDNKKLIVTFGYKWTDGRLPKKIVYKSSKPLQIPTQELEVQKERVAAMQEKRRIEEIQEAKRRQKNMVRDQQRFNAAATIGTAPYLERKNVQAHLIRFDNQIALVPLRKEVDGSIQSLQELHPEPFIEKESKERDKHFTGLIGGCFHVIGDFKPDGEAYFAEGYATSATVHEVTNTPTIMTINCGNMSKVIAYFHRTFPNLKITLVGDDDRNTPGNPGRSAIEKLSRQYECGYVLPKFPDPIAHKELTDFNDLFKVAPESVRDQLTKNIQYQSKNMNKTKEKTTPKGTQNDFFKEQKPVRFWEKEGLSYQKFPIQVLPPILKFASEEVSRVVKVPIEMAAATVLSATATSFHNHVIVMEKKNLEHYLSFFIIIVAQSSERKSKTYDIALEALNFYTKERESQHKKDMAIFKAYEKAINKQITEITKKITDQLDHGTIDRCATQIANLEELLKSKEVHGYKFFTNDSTEAAFVRCLQKNNGCFSLLSSEGGNVIDYIAGSKDKSHATNEAVFLKIITGDSIGRERIGQKGEGESIFILKPCGNILIFVQPERFIEFMANPNLRNCGLISRISPILAFENSMVGNRIELDDEGNLKGTENANLFEYEDMLLKFLRNKLIIRVELSKEAALARAKFHDQIERQLGIGGELHDVADIAGKATTFATKWAAVFYLSKNPSIFDGDPQTTFIDEETFIQASELQRYFLSQAINTQRTTKEDAWFLKAKKILDWLKKRVTEGKTPIQFSLADIYTKFGMRPKLTSEETKKIINLLTLTGWICKISNETERYSLSESIVL